MRAQQQKQNAVTTAAAASHKDRIRENGRYRRVRARLSAEGERVIGRCREESDR